jgi:uncharacterized protein
MEKFECIMGKRCLLLFCKYPDIGKVKTRLAIDVGEIKALELYKCMVEDQIKTVKQLDMSIIICYDPKESGVSMMKWLGPGLLYYAQTGLDLGKKLENAFYYAYSKGFSDVAVIGSDSPDLSVEMINESFDLLDTTEAVIGPASDGGYYLLGFNRGGFFLDVFKDIAWSTNMVYVQTWSKIRATGKVCEVLDEWNDVDTILDLEDLYKRNQNTWFKDSKTMQWIGDQGLFN